MSYYYYLFINYLIIHVLIVKCYQPKAGVGTDKVHAAPVVLGEEVVVGRDLWGDEDQVVDGEIKLLMVRSL